MPTTDFTDKTLNQKQRLNHYYLIDALRRFEWDMHETIAIDGRIPEDWHEISARRDRATTRVTIRLDTDVVKWFKSMGPRYQPRINDVLRAFMHAKLMGLLQGDDTIDAFRDGLPVGLKQPHWGKTAAEMDEITGKGRA